MPRQRSGMVLTPRQLEVVRLVAEGLPNKKIAQALGISVNTVEDHLKRIFERLNVVSRGQTIRWALENNTTDKVDYKEDGGGTD